MTEKPGYVEEKKHSCSSPPIKILNSGRGGARHSKKRWRSGRKISTGERFRSIKVAGKARGENFRGTDIFSANLQQFEAPAKGIGRGRNLQKKNQRDGKKEKGPS